MKKVKVNYDIYPTSVQAGETQTLDLFLSNYADDGIPFVNEQRLEAGNYPAPETEDEQIGNNLSGFYLYFLYGEGEANMVSVDDSVNIEVSLKAGRTEKWSVGKGTSTSVVGQYWVVAPKENITFERGEELVVTISNIKVDSHYGKAPLCLMMRHDREKTYHSIGITKYFVPSLKKFDITPSQYMAGADITLEWELEHGEFCNVIVDGVRQNENKITVSSKEEQHRISVCDKEGNLLQQSIRLPIIDSFREVIEKDGLSEFLSPEEVNDENRMPLMAQPYEPPGPTPPIVYKNVKASWSTHNTVKCTLDKISAQEQPPQGTAVVRIPVDQMSLKLYAMDENGHIACQTISLSE